MRAMGPEQAAVVLVTMLERFGDIRSPAGYLRALTQKAELGASCVPMVMAQLRRAACGVHSCELPAHLQTGLRFRSGKGRVVTIFSR